MKRHDGHVTWFFDNDGALTDVHIARGWTQLDYYATNGYGNETSKYGCEDGERHGGRSPVTEVLEESGIPWEFSSVNDGADNEQAYAAILVVRTRDIDRIASALLAAELFPDDTFRNIPACFQPTEHPYCVACSERRDDLRLQRRQRDQSQWDSTISKYLARVIPGIFPDAEAFDANAMIPDARHLYMPLKDGWQLTDGTYLGIYHGDKHLAIWGCSRERAIAIAARIFPRELSEHEFSGFYGYDGLWQ